MDLTINQSEQDGVSVIAAVGDADVYTAPLLRDPLREAAQAGNVVLDLERCEFLDSTGLGVILGAKKLAQASGYDVAIAVSRDEIMRAFRITGLTNVLTIRGTVDEAVKALNGDG